MRFLMWLSWEPDRAKEMTERFKKWVTPEGVKGILPTHTVMGRNEAFSITEVDDPKLLAIYDRRWRDIAVVEFIPIMETSEIVKIE
jgi:hypothetical protein